MKHVFITLTLLLLFVAVGCKQGSRVSGKVTFEDGSPVPRGTVMFSGEKTSFQGAIKNGTYAVGVTRDSQKIPLGKYKVWLANTPRIETVYDKHGNATTAQVTFAAVMPEFASNKNTPLEADITSGGSLTYDITVKAHPDKDKQQKYKPKEGTGK
jgi:hypothetical protein